MKYLSVLDIIISAAICVLIFIILLPAVARVERTKDEAICQSNMRCIARAMDLYLGDNHNTYPTNRKIVPLTGQWSTNFTPSIALTSSPSSDLPMPKNNLNWVEALYPYLADIGIRTGRDWKTCLACTKPVRKHPLNASVCPISYAFNINMCEKTPSYLRNVSKLMMLREIDARVLASLLKPINNSTGSSTLRPEQAFLTASADPYSGGQVCDPNLHSNGSYIAFADGHVTWFITDYYPTDDRITAVNSYDTETQQWYNYAKGNTSVPESMIRSIAITP